MCGICGVICPKGKLVEYSILKRMCKVIIHRGPDDSGTFIKENVGLGVQRLSIIDLEGGHQPICNEDETVWIAFNGEIYNYLALREFLQKKGHRFSTMTDTECIVHLYEEFGIECVKELKGMFAFAIWDDNKKHLYLARDRFGIKPLYYTETDGKFLFASEVKAILEHPAVTREVELSSIHDYLSFLYVPAPKTMFKGIKKLPAAHWLKFNEGQIQIKRYWKLEFNHTKNSASEEEHAQQVYELFRESVKMRLI